MTDYLPLAERREFSLFLANRIDELPSPEATVDAWPWDYLAANIEINHRRFAKAHFGDHPDYRQEWSA